MLPAHLKRYVVEQDYSRYTPEDQEVWRYIMHQLRDFLSKHAHPCYIDGLAKTGIETDRIPEIKKMSEKLERFGWRAVPVSGFIPPAAFMELQALGYLPIASDMRTADHLLYTPAPDIVHEAAGHAPILIEPEYAGYLRAYAQVAKKAIIGKSDMDQYEAIRVLSDLKEDPNSTSEQISAAEKHLVDVTTGITNISEAALLSRMNWWTAEYGLIGTVEEPRLFGAGLLSSVLEATACLSPKVRKIPLTIDCINYSYDITEPQPQLFVTPSFGHLVEVLEELAATMAYRLGGVRGLEKARLAETVNTVEFNSGVQISGLLKRYIVTAGEAAEAAYLQFEGPTQICLEGEELPGHGNHYHAAGYGTPVGFLEGAAKCLSEMNEQDLRKIGVVVDGHTELRFANGTRVKGQVTGWLRSPLGRLMVVSFRNCTVVHEASGNKQTLFEPSWGLFDMAVGSSISSVFGGPADRIAFGETSDFAAKQIPRRVWPKHVQEKHALYQELREIRSTVAAFGGGPSSSDKSGTSGNHRDVTKSSREENGIEARVQTLYAKLKRDLPEDWLSRVALAEIITKIENDRFTELRQSLNADLESLSKRDALTGTTHPRRIASDCLNRIRVVLHRPIYPRNIGMCARAMANMGLEHLILIAPVTALDEYARQGAAHAQAILRNAVTYSSQEEFLATEGEGIRIALSGRDGRLKAPDWLGNVLEEMKEEPEHSIHDSTIPIYLFFGPEDDGLDLHEMENCHHICRLPTFGEITSLNLSHAVLLTCYMLQNSLGKKPGLEVDKLAPAQAQRETKQKMYYPSETIKKWMEALGFDLSARRVNIEKIFNRILISRCPTPEELRVVDSVLQQTVRKLTERKQG